MTIFQKKPLTAEEQEIAAVKDFFDMLLPGAILPGQLCLRQHL